MSDWRKSVERWDWIKNSRLEWYSKDGKQGGDELYFKLGIACLQRIATSLEKIESHLNSEERKNRRSSQRWAERWSPIRKEYDRIEIASNRAFDRISGSRKKLSEMKHGVLRAFFSGQPKCPYRDYCSDEPVDIEVVKQWSDAAIAYWDGITELPARIAKEGTKKQARYLEWKGSSDE